MKCIDSFVLGIAFGMLFTCFLMWMYGAPKMCEVSMGDLNHTHVRYGVVVGGM